MKKFATLLPNNWLAKTPLDSCGGRLGRQSAERERIFEINWNFLKKNCRLVYSEPCLRLVYPLCFFSVILIGLKKFATLLPNNWLAKTPLDSCGGRLGRQSAERERISEINSNVFICLQP
ncbi:hypothetical protein [Peribacillus simplex]|uniref:hypothetical protein n=1 Tax=Peribacillus simplex TaxID=1478 RepID=UPI0011DD728F|nr:hypothetical protein [Peribacillus simplex]